MKLTTNELRKMIVEELNNIIGEDAADDMMQKMKSSKFSTSSGAGADAATFAANQDLELGIENLIGDDGLELVENIKRLSGEIYNMMRNEDPADFSMYGFDRVDPTEAKREERSKLFAQLENMKKALDEKQRAQLDALIARYMKS